MERAEITWFGMQGKKRHCWKNFHEEIKVVVPSGLHICLLSNKTEPALSDLVLQNSGPKIVSTSVQV